MRANDSQTYSATRSTIWKIIFFATSERQTLCNTIKVFKIVIFIFVFVGVVVVSRRREFLKSAETSLRLYALLLIEILVRVCYCSEKIDPNFPLSALLSHKKTSSKIIKTLQ